MFAFYRADDLVPSNALGYLLRRASKLNRARAEAAFAGTPLSFTQWIVLALVHSGTASTCAALARDIGHSSGAMTRLVDQLEQHGLLEREPDAADRRIIRLRITPAGAQMVTELAARVAALWNEVLEGFEPGEVLQLITTLNKLVARLEALSGEGE